MTVTPISRLNKKLIVFIIMCNLKFDNKHCVCVLKSIHKIYIALFFGLLVLLADMQFSSNTLHAQPYNQNLYENLTWRAIGPLRGGRMHALDGVPGSPHIFYAGADNGGIWKSTSYGAEWDPIFDDQPTGSIGAIRVAPSNPDIIYVGTGAGIIRPDDAVGKGMFKSVDGGKSWIHLGLRDTHKINEVIVDPKNPNRLFVAALGHPFGPNEERGIFRSTDGGQSFEKILYINEYTGGDDVDFDPRNTQTLYATMWQFQSGPWENGDFDGTDGGVFKSTDGGNTWKKIMRGLPENTTQVLLAVAPSNPDRIYASVATGNPTSFYRSDDAGESWYPMTEDVRPTARVGGGDLPELTVDPTNADIVYSNSTVLWRTLDAGKTWTGINGAIGGDDYQRLWIDPNNPKILLSVVDQGVVVSQDFGETWTSWYNQPTAAMYDVSTTNSFPYMVCGGQQDSGSACVSSKGPDGQLTAHDWHPVGATEYGRATADPLNFEYVYGGKVTRYNRNTSQIQDVSQPRGPDDGRVVRTMPLIFSEADQRVLFSSTNVVWKTTNGGINWTKISSDLTRKGNWTIPSSVSHYADEITEASKNRAVVYSLAPSPLDIDILWAGTDDGVIQLTTDGGKTWKDVTPPQLKPWWWVYDMEASHFDEGTAYATIRTLHLDDYNPHVFRTRDFGRTWQEINTGIHASPTNRIIEDPVKKGLLFVGTEEQVFVSFDDGEHWQSLRLNMPAISIRGLTVKDDDLVIATHGRGFQILDKMSLLRQINSETAKADVLLYEPADVVRVRFGMNPPTEWRMPFMNNPPFGASIDYYLARDVAGMVELDIFDSAGKLVRHFDSKTLEFEPIPEEELRYPVWWPRHPQLLSTKAGHHRFIWDLHYTEIPGIVNNLDASQGVRKNQTPKVATAPWVMPGEYTVRLTVNGKRYTQNLNVLMDPTIPSAMEDLQKQFDLSKGAYDQILDGVYALGQIRYFQDELETRINQIGENKIAASYMKKLEELAGPKNADRFFFFRYNGPPVFTGLAQTLWRQMAQMQDADYAPTEAQKLAYERTSQEMQNLLASWDSLKGKPLQELNKELVKHNVRPLDVIAEAMVPHDWNSPFVKYYRNDM